MQERKHQTQPGSQEEGGNSEVITGVCKNNKAQ